VPNKVVQWSQLRWPTDHGIMCQGKSVTNKNLGFWKEREKSLKKQIENGLYLF
jgi:hypothetical protein